MRIRMPPVAQKTILLRCFEINSFSFFRGLFVYVLCLTLSLFNVQHVLHDFCDFGPSVSDV